MDGTDQGPFHDPVKDTCKGVVQVEVIPEVEVPRTLISQMRCPRTCPTLLRAKKGVLLEGCGGEARVKLCVSRGATPGDLH